MEVIVFSVSVNHVNGSHLDFTFLIPYGLYLLLCLKVKLVDCLEKCLIYGHIRRFAD